MYKYIVCFFLVLSLATPGFAVKPWIDSWNKASYYTTNTESKNFNAFLGRTEQRVGLDLADTIAEIPSFSPYAAVIAVASQDKNYWNNNYATGYGIRIMPFENYKSAGWADEWIKDVKVFGEVLTLSYLKDEDTAAANRVPGTDKRVGFDLYHEWNQEKPDKKYSWAEVWANLSYRTTNFYEYPDGFKTYRFAHEQKTGIYLEDETIMPYLRTDFIMSGKPDPWLNNILVGPGLQVKPVPGQNISIYLEMLSIIWYKEKNSRPQSDLRFGAEYRLYIK